MENTPVQPLNNSSQNNNSSTPPVMPPTPQPSSPAELAPKKSFKPLLFILASLFFLSIAGVTGYVYISNQKELANIEGSSQKTPSPTTPPQLSPSAGSNEGFTLDPEVVCARFEDLETALQYPEKTCTLDLSGKELSTVPNEVFEFPNLYELNLSNNNISTFPTQLLDIESLVTLDLSDNNISSIPKEIPDNQNDVRVTMDKSGKEVFSAIKFPQIFKLKGNPLPADTIAQYERSNN